VTGLVWLLLAATPVEVSATGCAFAAEEVKRIASIELGRGPEAARVAAALSCEGDSLVVRVDDSVTQKVLERRLPLGALAPATRARYAALAIAELVEASWSELLLPVPPAPVEPSLREAAVRALPSRRLRLGAVGTVRSFVTRGVLQGGAALRGEVGLAGVLGVAVEVGAAHGEVAVAHGRASADTLDGAAFVTAALEWEPVLLGVGLGARLGGARLVGVPDDPTRYVGGTLSSGLVGPAARLEGAVRFGWFELSLGAEAGVAMLRLQGSVLGQPATGLTGAWVTGMVGAGVRL
jgi:hypothetical protein